MLCMSVRTRLFFIISFIGGIAFSSNFAFAQSEKGFACIVSNESPMPPMPLTPIEEKNIWVGVTGGPNFVSYKTSSFPILNSQPDCYSAQNGKGLTPSLGISAIIPLGWDNNHFIVFEAIYDVKSGKFNSENNTSSNIPTKINGGVQNGSITTDMAASLSYLLINAGYKYNFSAATMPVGPNIQIVLSGGINLIGNFNKTLTISTTDPNGSSQSHVEKSTVKIDNVEKFRFALRGQFGYDIPLSLQLFLSPFIGYDLPLTHVDDTGRNWKASSLYAGMAFHFSTEAIF
jgi:hypothetical protein